MADVPPGGALFELMSGDECIQTSPTLTDVDKPPCLSMLDDSKWRSWHAELSEVVEQYWNMAIPIAIAPFGFLVVVAVAILQFAEVIYPPIWVLPATIVPFLLISFLAHCVVVGKNAELDEHIRELCAKLSSFSDGAVKVEYRTRWTGLCKPKRARTRHRLRPCGGRQRSGRSERRAADCDSAAGAGARGQSDPNSDSKWYSDRQHPSGTQPGSDFHSPAACHSCYASCPSASC